MMTVFKLRYQVSALLVSLVGWCAGAQADCHVAPVTIDNPINFGSVPSQNIPPGGISPNGGAEATHFSASCDNALASLNLLNTSSWLQYTVMQPLTLTNGTDTINYVIASNASYNPIITTQGGSIGGTGGFNLLAITLLFGSNELRVPIFMRTSTTSIWPSAGVYTGTQQLHVTGSMCTLLGIGPFCLGSSPVEGTVSMNLALTVSKSCEFSSVSSQVDFGVVGFLEDAGTAQLSATVRCTKEEDYALYADDGDNYSSGSRHMDNGAGTEIAYGIFHDGAPSQPLTDVNPMSRIGTGGLESLAFPVQITPGQQTPSSGLYRDYVRLILEY